MHIFTKPQLVLGNTVPAAAMIRHGGRLYSSHTLEGTQPTLRQSPPMACCSTKAHVLPSPLAMITLSKPAAPEPITTCNSTNNKPRQEGGGQ